MIHVIDHADAMKVQDALNHAVLFLSTLEEAQGHKFLGLQAESSPLSKALSRACLLLKDVTGGEPDCVGGENCPNGDYLPDEEVPA